MAEIMTDAAWLAELRKVQDLRAEQHQPQLALDRLRGLLASGRVPEKGLWRGELETAYAYGDLLEPEKECEAFWRTLLRPGDMGLRSQMQIYSNFLFTLHCLPRLSDAEHTARHFGYDQLARAVAPFAHPPERHRHAKLRIGYLLPTLREHVESYFVVQLLTAYDKRRFEVYFYGLSEETDAFTDSVAPFVQLRPLPREEDPRVLARRIYDDEIDILFDASVHTGGGLTMQVMAHRPAPVQVAGIGYMSTSGTRRVDYFLTDRYLDPPGAHDADFAEKLLRLDRSHFDYTPPERILRAKGAWRPSARIRFGCFQKISKISDDLLRAWQEILAHVPKSTLLIKNASASTWNTRALERRMKRLGFAADSYAIEGPTGDYYDRYAAVDIMLDTYPYVGGASTCDALLRGVPVTSRYGTRHGTRFGLSLLTNVGHAELAAATERDYIEKAVALAHDPARLAALHASLTEDFCRSPVMDHAGYLHAVEQLYETIWQNYLLTRQGSDFKGEFL